MNTLKEFAGVLTSVTALLAGVAGLLRYFQYKTRRDKVTQVREAFDSVVRSLASEIEVERTAGAILLRRFFDRETELGVAGRPYWKEAVDVTAAILRGQSTGNFQKLLADGLAYAPSLERADLQKTNLQYAYLGARAQQLPWHRRLLLEIGYPSMGLPPPRTLTQSIVTNLSSADFYRADLSRASLKEARAPGGVFYQARMHNTVFTRANLRDANFFEADLKGAKFDGALLRGARFQGARNVPWQVGQGLDENGVYRSDEPCPPAAVDVEGSASRVFISKPGCMDDHQQRSVATLLSRMEQEGFAPTMLERPEYPSFGPIAEVQRLMGDCAGAVIFGFVQMEVREGAWRLGTAEERQVANLRVSTPWNQIEAGMAAALGLPMLVLCQKGVTGGIFDIGPGEHDVHRASIEEDWNAEIFSEAFSAWCSDVRERARNAGSSSPSRGRVPASVK